MAERNLSQNKVTGYLEQIIGSNLGKRVPLYDFDVVFGRSKSAHIRSEDLNVSRCHCSLKYTPTGWFITDLGSVNGTYINDSRVPKNSSVPLNDGCSIYFGPKEDAPEGYKFESMVSSNEVSFENELVTKSSRSKSSSIQNLVISKSKKRKASPTPISLAKNKEKKFNDDVSVLNKRNKKYVLIDDKEDGNCTDSSISSLDSLKTRIRKAHSSQKKRNEKAKYCYGENFIAPSTSAENQPFERIPFKVTNSDEENSISLLNEPSYPDYNSDCSSCKNSPVKSCAYSNEINSSSVAVHSNLLKVLQKKVNDLQKTLKALNLKFADTMNENAKLAEVLKSKEHAEVHIKEDFKKLLEDELICNICTELFIKPITLGCSHTFCQHCIFEWKKKKKQCPMCREKIESETTILFLDNFINKAVEQLDPASLERRFDLMKNREESQKKKPKKKKSKISRRRNAESEEHPGDEVELLRSRISEIQSYTDDIQTYVDVIDELINERYSDNDEGNTDGYYGGYGRCYSCGRMGHWANGCPF